MTSDGIIISIESVPIEQHPDFREIIEKNTPGEAIKAMEPPTEQQKYECVLFSFIYFLQVFCSMA